VRVRGARLPPSGFAICFLRSVAPPEVKTSEIYAGVAPILVAQVAVIAAMWAWPSFTWLPRAFAAS
jgi:TRAP-type mannitol/chloroaromatic compound transport system permease large subunit